MQTSSLRFLWLSLLLNMSGISLFSFSLVILVLRLLQTNFGYAYKHYGMFFHTFKFYLTSWHVIQQQLLQSVRTTPISDFGHFFYVIIWLYKSKPFVYWILLKFDDSFMVLKCLQARIYMCLYINIWMKGYFEFWGTWLVKL